MDHTQDLLELARRDLARRHHQELEQAAAQQRPWLYAFVGLSLTLLLGVMFLPISTLEQRLQMIVAGVCAQQHFLYIGTYTMPLCARNTGIYSGFLASVLFLLAIGRKRAAKLPPLAITLFLLGTIGLLAIDGFNSLALDVGGYNAYIPDNRLRVITGLGMGITIGTFLLLMFNLSLRYDADHQQRVVGSWIEVLGMIGAAALLYGLFFFAPAWLFYPLAFFSVFGIVGVLFMSNVFVIGMISGLEGRMIKLQQLARPATIGLALTALELALLSGMRIWAEQALGLT